MLHRLSIGFVIVFAALGGVNALEGPKLARFEFQEPHMGTLFRIVLYAPDEATAKKAARDAFARIAELNRIMSDYLEDSELMQLCKKAGGPPVQVSEDLFKVLEKAQETAKLSDGAFDVSIGPVVRLWRKARRTKTMPSKEEIRKALDLVNYRNIALDPRGRTVRLLLMGMLLDLGGIAKGYAADAALAVLARHGITRALVAAGGDVAVADAPPDAEGWVVGIAPLRDPSGPPSHHLLLKRAAVSTAGDTHQFVEIEGKRYSHIIDPKTGVGLTGRRSVSVIAPNGLTADALDTAAALMGPEKGMQMLERQPGVAALFVYETDQGEQTRKTENFTKWELHKKQ